MLEVVILVSLALFFVFFLVNYAELFNRPRHWVMPRLHSKIAYSVTCPICFSFWVLSAFSLFVGFTPLVVFCPVVTLFFDLAFHKLRDGCR